MAMMTVLLSVLALCAIAGNVESASHHNAPAPAVDCTSLVMNLADCLSYVSNGSTAKKPDGNCCSGLKKVLKTDAECLCEAFKNSAQLGLTLNMTRALALPSACHLSAPSLSKCGLSLGPGSAPAMSPAAAISPSAIAGVPTAAAGTNEVSPAPATATGKSGSAAVATSVGSLILALVVVASFSYA